MSELRKQNAIAKVLNASEYGVLEYDFHDKAYLRYIGSSIARYDLPHTLIDDIVARSNRLDDLAKHQLEVNLTRAYNFINQRKIDTGRIGGVRID